MTILKPTVEKAGIGRFVANLASGKPVVRQSARESLVALGSTEVTAALVAGLADPREQVRWEAAKALSVLADPAAAAALAQALVDDSEGVRWLAAEGLMALDKEGLIAVLNELTKHASSTAFCHSAHHVLRNFNQGPLAEIIAPVLVALAQSQHGISAPLAAYNALLSLKGEATAAAWRSRNNLSLKNQHPRSGTMAIPHAKPSEVIDIRPLAERFKAEVTSTLVKTNALEVLRLVLPAGEKIRRHQTPGEITVQCLEGRVLFDADGADRELSAGEMLYLNAGTPHALRAVEDSSVLVTILLQHKTPTT